MTKPTSDEYFEGVAELIRSTYASGSVDDQSLRALYVSIIDPTT